MERVRFSEVLRDFNKEVAALPDAARKKIVEAVKKCGKKVGERKLDGRTVDRVEVDFAGVLEALPAELKGEGKAVARAAAKESAYRGEAWAEEGLHASLVEFVTGK